MYIREHNNHRLVIMKAISSIQSKLVSARRGVKDQRATDEAKRRKWLQKCSKSIFLWSLFHLKRNKYTSELTIPRPIDNFRFPDKNNLIHIQIWQEFRNIKNFKKKMLLMKTCTYTYTIYCVYLCVCVCRSCINICCTLGEQVWSPGWAATRPDY